MAKKYSAGETLAITCAKQYGQIDGDHHKAWVIDRMCRYILGSDYEGFIASCEEGEDGPHTYKWDTGIAP